MSLDTRLDTRHDPGTRSDRRTGAPPRPSAPGLSTPGSSHRQAAHGPTTHIVGHTALIRAGVVASPDHRDLALERMTPSLLRVALEGRTIGFVEHVGRVYVALAGEHYDRAVEVAQTLDVAHAARALA